MSRTASTVPLLVGLVLWLISKLLVIVLVMLLVVIVSLNLFLEELMMIEVDKQS